MGAFKNSKNGTWHVQFWYTDWKGERQQKFKRGFATKREAQEWEREFLMQKQADVTMKFDSFAELYEKDVKPKLKENTWITKESIIQKKILPYFGNRKLCDITAKDVIEWQNEIRKLVGKDGKKHSKTYLKTVHNQLSALFNHAVRFYGLKENPAAKAGNMGTEERKEMSFWTVDEYKKFSEVMMDKTISFYAFEMLYWCGIREGEMLALYPSDFDFEKSTVRHLYVVENRDVLEYIARNDIYALRFLQCYIEKVLTDSGMMATFNSFFENQDSAHFNAMKQAFIDFYHEYTPVKKEFEPKRIFTKVVNPLAFGRDKYGSEKIQKMRLRKQLTGLLLSILLLAMCRP